MKEFCYDVEHWWVVTFPWEPLGARQMYRAEGGFVSSKARHICLHSAVDYTQSAHVSLTASSQILHAALFRDLCHWAHVLGCGNYYSINVHQCRVHTICFVNSAWSFSTKLSFWTPGSCCMCQIFSRSTPGMPSGVASFAALSSSAWRNFEMCSWYLCSALITMC